MALLRESLDELRALFYPGPNPSTWRAVCALIEHWPQDQPGLDITLDYALQQLSLWPDTARVAPTHWLQTPRPGEKPDTAPHLWSLARTINLDRRPHRGRWGMMRARTAGVSTLSEWPEIAHITHLEVQSSGRPDTLAKLAQSPNLKNITHLSLGRCDFSNKDIDALCGPTPFGDLQSLSLLGIFEPPRSITEALYRAEGLGNLHTLALSGAGQTPLSPTRLVSRTSALAGLTHLNLKEIQLHEESFARMLAALDMPNLRSLDLSRNRLREEGAALLRDADALAGLEHLALNVNSFKPECALIALDADALQNLKSLELGNCRLHEKGTLHVASRYPGGPPRLGLRGNEIHDKGAAALGKAVGLHTLDLTNNEIRLPGLAGLLQSTHIEDLNLHNNRIKTGNATPPLGGGGRLKHLTISSNRMQDTAAIFLSRCPQLGGLQTLDLHDNLIRDEGLAALASSPHLSNLRELDLSQNKIKAEGIAALVRSQHLSKLQRLNLSRNPIPAEAVLALVESTFLPNLRELDLTGVPIGKRGARVLANAAWSQQLEALRVSPDLVSEVGMKHLIRSTHLSLTARAILQSTSTFGARWQDDVW